MKVRRDRGMGHGAALEGHTLYRWVPGQTLCNRHRPPWEVLTFATQGVKIGSLHKC